MSRRSDAARQRANDNKRIDRVIARVIGNDVFPEGFTLWELPGGGAYQATAWDTGLFNAQRLADFWPDVLPTRSVRVYGKKYFLSPVGKWAAPVIAIACMGSWSVFLPDGASERAKVVVKRLEKRYPPTQSENK